MILSHHRAFIFLRTQKTASTSIAIGLSEFCGPSDIVTPLRMEDEAVRTELGFTGPQNHVVPLSAYGLRDWAKLALRHHRLHYMHHMAAADVSRLVGRRVWDGYFKFAVERNPWDKVVSAYHWRNRDVPEPWLTFSEWLRSPEGHVAAFETYSIDGRVAVDRVLRFEDLDAELREVATRLGLPHPIHLPRTKVRPAVHRRPYRELIGDEDRELIARRYAREIALMGYEF